MKKVISILLFLCSFAYGETKLTRIDIIQTIAHPALDNTRRGIIDQLALDGFIDGNNTEIKFSNAQGDSVLSNQIAQKFISTKPDAIIAIPTPAAQSAANATRNTNIPVIFSSVTDPLDAGLVKNLNQPEANITGVSNFIELDQQLLLFKEILPNLNKLGFIYNPGEANSVKMLKSLQDQAKLYNIQIITAVAGKTTEISSATGKLIGKVEAIFISNDNTALAAFPVITKLALAAKIPVFVSDTDMVSNGALAALGPNQYEVGRQTGKMVAAILRGTLIRDLAVEFPLKVELILNQKIANELGLSFSNKLLSQAKS